MRELINVKVMAYVGKILLMYYWLDDMVNDQDYYWTRYLEKVMKNKGCFIGLN